MNAALFQSLGIVDCGILRYCGDQRFDVVSCNDQWFNQLFPTVKVGSTFELPDDSAFLNDFLYEAKEFWQKHNAGQIHSGLWTEDVSSGQLHLEAIAAFAGGERFLVINNMAHHYKHQQNTLQVARELLLTHDRMLAQHQTMQDRLASLLSKNASLLELNLPIQQAIEHANLAVIITDNAGKPTSINPAAWKLFALSPTQHDQTPLNIFNDIFNRQFPEAERIVKQRANWSGELYWYSPPQSHKWFQAEMHPVLDAQRLLKHWIITLSDMTRVKYLVQHNEKLALHDSLTGLPNRQYFWQRVEQIIAAEKPFHIIYLDIENFKQVNDLYGFLAGDDLLISVSKRIKKVLQKEDFFAHIGADEFAIIVRNDRHNAERVEPDESGFNQCLALAERIREQSSLPYYTERDARCNLPVRIGITQFPKDGLQAEELMKAADLALQAAKLFSQEPIHFYSPELKTASEARLHLEARLRDAIAEEKLELYLQPIIDLSSGKLIKAEVLLRWFPTAQECISPDTFIPVAEQSGLINPLGKWVVTKACQILSQFQKRDINIKLSLNLSPRQVADHTLLEFIRNAAQDSHINASRLELELTEGVLVDNYEKARRLLSSLRDMGITIAIDDFGTGYSSLAYLKHLPIDYLKIDRSFISDLESDPDDKAIVLAILALADQLKLSVIAEGVETHAQGEFLKAHRCASAQGYFYARPMPIDAFYTYCQQHH